MAVFKAFKPEAMNKIAKAMGYTGDMGQFQDFVEQDPARQARMDQFKNAAVQMARGGMVRMQEGGDPPSLEDQLASAQEAFNNTRYARIGIGKRQDTIDLSRIFGTETDESPSGKQIIRFGTSGGRRYEVRGEHYDDGQSTLGQFVRARRKYDAAQKRVQDIQNQIEERAAQEAEAEAERQRKAEEEAKRKAEEDRIAAEVERRLEEERRKAEEEKKQQPKPEPQPVRPEPRPEPVRPEPRPQPVRPPGTITTRPRPERQPEGLFPDDISVRPEPQPVRPEPQPVRPEPQPVRPEPQPVRTDLQPVLPEPTRPRPTMPPTRRPTRPQPDTFVRPPIQQPMTYYTQPVSSYAPQPQIPSYAQPTGFGGYSYDGTRDLGYMPSDIQYTLQQPTIQPIGFERGGVVNLQEGGLVGKAVASNVQRVTGALGEDQFGNMPVGKFQETTPRRLIFDPRMLPKTMAVGEDDTTPEPPENEVPEGKTDLRQETVKRMYDPRVPQGAVVQAQQTLYDPQQYVDPRTGMVGGFQGVGTTTAATQQAELPEAQGAAQYEAATAAKEVDQAVQATQAAQVNPNDPRAQVVAAQQTASSVGDVKAAQGNAILMDNPVQREIQEGELITGAADAQKAAQFTEQVQAATATPSQKATVQGQLAGLMQQFEGGETPSWAAGAMRAATQAMASRGLGASSIAGQAIVQAAMESALPIAQADASTVAQFEQQNLSNRQQRAMLAAQQRATFMGQEFDQAFQARVQNAARIGDVANMNFTAEQQVQLENSRIANTMNLQNLSNSQAMVMAEAAALANLDMANLNNRQQAAVQNAQAFMQRDLANLSNQQQTELFKAQQRTQALFTDQAAVNAAAQFNATSENQTNQFFANLQTQARQFNVTQANAQSQFNAGQRNAMEKFNLEIANQRDQFNAQNQLVVAQSNAQWRRQIATQDTAAINRANEINAQNVLDVSNQAYANLWQHYGDTMEWAWTSAENQLDRMNALALAEISAEAQKAIASAQASSAAGSAVGSLIGTLGSAFIEFCWVAQEVYGAGDPRWFMFRTWMKKKAPKWLYNLYEKHGESFADYIKDKPYIKYILKKLMNLTIDKKYLEPRYGN
jgi:hypothetical protein